MVVALKMSVTLFLLALLWILVRRRAKRPDDTMSEEWMGRHGRGRFRT